MPEKVVKYIKGGPQVHKSPEVNGVKPSGVTKVGKNGNNNYHYDDNLYNLLVIQSPQNE